MAVTEGFALLGRGHIIFSHIVTCAHTKPCWTTTSSFVLPKHTIRGMIVAVRVLSKGSCNVLTDGQGRWDGAIIHTTGRKHCGVKYC